MNWLTKFKYIKSRTKENEEIKDIISKLPDNKECAKEILESMGNDTSRIILDGGLKNSYYIFLNDTIYLSNREKNKKAYTRICLVAHECIHSMQSKILQKVNFILSNIEIISFILIFILLLLNKQNNIFIYSYYGLVVLSIIPRIILELDAVIKSVPMATRYLSGKLEENELSLVKEVYNFQIKLFLPLFVIGLLIGKILRVAIIQILYTY
jgi:Zn-dependent membrane protease YugP